MFILWHRRKLEAIYCNWFANILLANEDKLNLNLPRFTRPLYFFFVIRPFGKRKW